MLVKNVTESTVNRHGSNGIFVMQVKAKNSPGKDERGHGKENLTEKTYEENR